MAARPGSSLAEQAREYGQAVRSKHHHDWLPPAASSSSSSSSRPDAVLVIGELFMFAFLIFSGVSLYFRYMSLAFLFLCITALIFICMKIVKQVRQNRDNKRRMLLPLSM